MPADRTAFRTGIPLVDGYDRSAIPGSFVLQLSHQFAPADIGYRFGQVMVLQQVFDGQRLDTHHLVFADETSRQFVQKITAPISYAGMEASLLCGEPSPGSSSPSASSHGGVAGGPGVFPLG